MLSVRLLSPAKVNLNLRVLGRRQDGYHELDTVLQSIDLCDELSLELTGEDLRVISPPHLPSGPDNICFRAAEGFFAHIGRPARCSILLTKRIPVQAGLGGGSSNAALVLVALNYLHDHRLSSEELVSLASNLGSDVPFFLLGGTVRARGRGERLEALPDARPRWLRLVKPPVGLSTAEVYARWRPPDDRRMRRDDEFFNDLEATAQTLLPALKDIVDLLMLDGAEQAILCGSGSTVCGFYSSPPSRPLALPPNYWTCVTRTMSRMGYERATSVKEHDSL